MLCHHQDHRCYLACYLVQFQLCILVSFLLINHQCFLLSSHLLCLHTDLLSNIILCVVLLEDATLLVLIRRTPMKSIIYGVVQNHKCILAFEKIQDVTYGLILKLMEFVMTMLIFLKHKNYV